MVVDALGHHAGAVAERAGHAELRDNGLADEALLFASLFRNSASSASILKATSSDFGDFRGMSLV